MNFLPYGYLLSMSPLPSLIPFMPKLSVKLRIKINYHQLNAIIPNTHSNAFQPNSGHYQQLTKWCYINFTEITLFSRVTDSLSDLEKSSFNPTLHGLKNSFGMSNTYYKNICKEEKSIATFHSLRPKLSKSYFVAVAFQAKFSSSTKGAGQQLNSKKEHLLCSEMW